MNSIIGLALMYLMQASCGGWKTPLGSAVTCLLSLLTLRLLVMFFLCQECNPHVFQSVFILHCKLSQEVPTPDRRSAYCHDV